MGAVLGLVAVVAAIAILVVSASGVLDGDGDATPAGDPAALVAGAAGDAAAANVGAATRAMEAYFAAHGSYAGVTAATLRGLDPTLDASVRVVRADERSYCVEAGVRGGVASVSGPGGTVVARPC